MKVLIPPGIERDGSLFDRIDYPLQLRARYSYLESSLSIRLSSLWGGGEDLSPPMEVIYLYGVGDYFKK